MGESELPDSIGLINPRVLVPVMFELRVRRPLNMLNAEALAVAVVDRNQQIQVWNGQARELWGVSPDEAEGQHLMALDIGLPLDQVRPYVRSALTDGAGREEIVLQATNRRGRAFQCRVTFLPLGEKSEDGRAGVIMTMEPLAE